MTALQQRVRPASAYRARHDQAPRRPGLRGLALLRRHWRSICTLLPLLVVVGLANGWNLQGWPGRVNDDEGTYVSEAWAVIVPHHLSQYTYWYDHPPLGWMLMAAYIWITRGFERYPSAVMAGREFMWVINLVSCVLLYMLARRLRFPRPFAAAVVVLFGLSPLAIYFHRMVFLDNISTMWMLAAFCLAASPRRSLAAATCSGITFALACLSKETIAIVWPALTWQLWQNSDPRTRRWNIAVFSTTFLLVLSGYPLFAALRGELLPGPGHVSLAHALWWQLVSRPSSGSVLDVHSAAFGLARSWLDLDPWLLGGGAVAALAGLALRLLRPVSAGFVIQAALLLKGGYVPYMYVTAMLPFAALALPGVLAACWRPARALVGAGLSRRALVLCGAGNALVLLAVTAFAGVAAPQWTTALRQQALIDGDAGSLAATAWINKNLGRGQLVVVDDYIWPDVTMHGRATPLWCWKVNGDPWVRRHLLPAGYKSIDYIVLPVDSSCELNHQQLPTLVRALSHSRVIRRFADGLVARKVAGK